MKAVPFVRPSLNCLTALIAAVVLTASCGATPHEAAVGHMPQLSSTAQAATPGRTITDDAINTFAVEEAMGAECRQDVGDDPPLQEAGCYGILPKHLRALVLNLPDEHPHLTPKEREEAASTRQWFRAVSGYGRRSDFVASVGNYSRFWIRSFEGVDPDNTVYVVYGPACTDDPALSTTSIEAGCLPGAPHVIRELKVYRFGAGGLLEDATSELTPPPPALTPDERKRYGVYLRPSEQGDAEDVDIGLDVRRLSTTPVMRWIIDPPEEGDYVRPRIPDSDPRGFNQQAHFGFLVWTGERFELREKIPLSLWACGVGGAAQDCLERFRGGGDPYLLDDDGLENPAREEP